MDITIRILKLIVDILQSELIRIEGQVTSHPNPLIEEYFNVVAMNGTTQIKWSIIQPAFLWKLNQVMNDMVLVEKDLKPKVAMEKRLTDSELLELKNYIMDKAKNFENSPFTIQRICELIALPTVHYRIAEKYYRALEKNINVVMEVTEDGKRITGVEEPAFIDDDAASSICETDDHIEKHFLVCVDEVDKSLEEQKRESMERSKSSSSDDEEERNTFRLPNRCFEIPDRPETPPPNEEVLKLSSEDMVVSDNHFDSPNKTKSPFKEPTLDMFTGDDSTKPSSSHGSEGKFATPELPPPKSPSPIKRNVSMDGSGDHGGLSDEEIEEIPAKMPKKDVPESMDE